MDDTEIIARWLETEAAQSLVGKLSQRVASNLSSAKIQPPFLESPVDRMEDVLQVLRSELSLFILEDRAHIKALLAAHDPKLPAYLQQAFMNHCIDLARLSGLDPLRYFRKRAGEVFRQTTRIHRKLKDGRFLMFSLHADNEEVRLPQDLEHCAIELPRHLAESLEYSAACKKDTVIDLAVHFWNRLSELMNGMRIWVDLRDFVKWVACYVPMHINVESADGKGTSGESDSIDLDQWDTATTGDPPLPPPTDDRLERLAAAFASKLDQKDRAVFYYRFFDSMNWEEVAHRTGFKGPSGPSYRFEEAKAVLKSLLREWPGLSPEDEDPETTDRFLEKLRAVLKKTLPAP